MKKRGVFASIRTSMGIKRHGNKLRLTLPTLRCSTISNLTLHIINYTSDLNCSVRACKPFSLHPSKSSKELTPKIPFSFSSLLLSTPPNNVDPP
jgi:hypothetical protein